MAAPSSDLIARARENNALLADLAAAGAIPIAERLVEVAMTTEDYELARKILDTLIRKAEQAEPKQAQLTLAPMNFTLVLDDNVPQEAPPKRNRTLALVEEVVPDPIEPPALPEPVPVPVSAPPIDLLKVLDE